MSKKIAGLGILVSALAGCSSTIVAVPTTESLGNIPTTFVATYDAVGDTMTLDDGTTAIVLPRQAIYDGTTFKGYFLSNISPNYAIYAVTPSGDGYALLAVRPGSSIAGTEFARLGDTELPGGGVVNYSGEYSAFVVADSSGLAGLLLFGDADLAADFNAGTMSGVISNRVDFTNGRLTYADLTLEASIISGGAFSGTTTGGAASGTYTSTTSAGEYSGLIVGPDGGEVVGGVVVGHIITGTTGPYTEYGAFVAD